LKKPELLAPAGNMEKLEVAVRYGADAVYLGGESFGLRNMAGNFSLHTMGKALELCHKNRVKAYLTVNSYPADSLLTSLDEYLRQAALLPFDAYIVADPGVLRMVRRISPEREIHLSTQANCINHEAALFWKEQGVARINLAREMTLEDIRSTVVNADIPCEVFIHGLFRQMSHIQRLNRQKRQHGILHPALQVEIQPGGGDTPRRVHAGGGG